MRYYSSTATDTTLTGNITSTSTSIVVASVSGFPVQFPFTLAIDFDAANEELVDVTAASGTTLTVTRGVDSTSAQAHSTGAKVKHVISGRDLRETQNHMAATTGVHGVSGALVGVTDAQTLTNKNLASDTNTFPSTFATLNGTQTLTNKDLSSGTNSFPSSLVTLTGSQTLTNKTLTSPILTTPTATVATNYQTATYGLVLSDAGKSVEMDVASANTVTVPTNADQAFPIGSQILVTQIGAGVTSFVAAAGVTIQSQGSKLKLNGQFASAMLLKRGTNTWLLSGNLVA